MQGDIAMKSLGANIAKRCCDCCRFETGLAGLTSVVLIVHRSSYRYFVGCYSAEIAESFRRLIMLRVGCCWRREAPIRKGHVRLEILVSRQDVHMRRLLDRYPNDVFGQV